MNKLILLLALGVVLGACAKNDDAPAGHINGANLCSSSNGATPCIPIASCNAPVLCSDVACTNGCNFDGVTCATSALSDRIVPPPRALTCGACSVLQSGSYFASECFR